MLGIILGFGSAIAFAFNAIITRRGVLRISSDYVANVSILIGPVFSCIAATISGDIFHLGHFPWKAFVFLPYPESFILLSAAPGLISPFN